MAGDGGGDGDVAPADIGEVHGGAAFGVGGIGGLYAAQRGGQQRGGESRHGGIPGRNYCYVRSRAAVGLLQAPASGRPDHACQTHRLTTDPVARRTYLSYVVQGARAFSVGANSFAMGSAAAPWGSSRADLRPAWRMNSPPHCSGQPEGPATTCLDTSKSVGEVRASAKCRSCRQESSLPE
ncbi:hypothetical protein D3C84_731440 [compost metagenome]